MNKDRGDWIAGGVFLSFIAALYLINAYNDLFSRRVAYLYDPASDDVYSIQMAPALDEYRKWEPLIPFKSLQYVEPDWVEYIGELDIKIAEYRADMELLRTDTDAWLEKEDRELEEFLSDLSSEDRKREVWDVEYFPRPDQRVQPLISATLSDILKDHEKQSEVMVVDAVIAHSVISNDRSSDEPTTIHIVREALLFQGSAAHALSEQGLY